MFALAIRSDLSCYIFAPDRCKKRASRSVCHPALPARSPRSTVPQQAVNLHAGGLVPMNLCLKILRLTFAAYEPGTFKEKVLVFRLLRSPIAS
ncbi:hypothetical protein MRX96_021864 [Rhipicephalus microplus]